MYTTWGSTSPGSFHLDHHSPRQVAQALGVSEASMKRWCDKDLIKTNRTAGGHRRIPLSAVMEFLKQTKHTLVNPELLGLPPGTGRKTSKVDNVQEHIVDVLVAGDRDKAKAMILDLYLSDVSLQEIFDKILAPAYHHIGEMWAHGDVHIFQERLACEIGTGILFEMRKLIDAQDVEGPLALGGTLSGDPYQLPIRMVEILLRDKGWSASCLGTDLPGYTLVEAINAYQPKLFWLSVSSIVDEATFFEDYTMCQQACEAQGCWLVIGGRALGSRIREQLKYTVYCDTMLQLDSFLDAMSQASKPGLHNQRTTGK